MVRAYFQYICIEAHNVNIQTNAACFELIFQNAIVTAAHCFNKLEKSRPDLVEVKAGFWNVHLNPIEVC